MMDFLYTLLALALPIAAVVGGIRYKTKTDLKKIELLSVNLRLGLDYVRNLKQSNELGQYPKLYKKLNQDSKELSDLIDRHGDKMSPQSYQEAVSMIHIASALQPKGNFLTDVTDGVLSLVEDIFPDAERVTAKLRPKEQYDNADYIYQAADEKASETLTRVRYIQQVAPEVLEVYTSLAKSNEQIVAKLKESELPNKNELLAIHHSNMRNFNDVLDGYIKIKEDPSQYFKAQERLDRAKQSLENGQQILTQTLRQINENDMMNFEISLRMLQNDN
ncbi:hypothetical protein [Streptococcus moroccensis]|uniref:Membrane associated protein n=1 Tax=Streptococcus moroccensis TaxID=1451356 RepID=A0ABT9YVI5_9STRE|nr:hypothetical protein [Streptococcus moroccensis]MDQ0223338.1 hypothetical protein [Streptococcus moroccensis]